MASVSAVLLLLLSALSHQQCSARLLIWTQAGLVDGSSSSAFSLAGSGEPYDGADSEYPAEAGVVSEEDHAAASSEPGVYYYVNNRPYKWLPWIWNSPHEDDVKLQMAQELAAAQEHLSSAELLRRLQVGRLEAAVRERRFTNMLSGLVDWVMGGQRMYDYDAPQQQQQDSYEYYDSSGDSGPGAATVDSSNYFDDGEEYDDEDDEQEEEYEDDAEWEAAFRAAGLRARAQGMVVEPHSVMELMDGTLARFQSQERDLDDDDDDNASTITVFSSEPDASVTSTVTTTTTTNGDSSSNEVFVYGRSNGYPGGGSGFSGPLHDLDSTLNNPVAVLKHMVEAVLGQGADPLMELRQANLHAQLAVSHDAMYELEEQEQRAAEDAALLQWVGAAAAATSSVSDAQEPQVDEAQYDWWWTVQKPASSATATAATSTETTADSAAPAPKPSSSSSFFSNVASVFSLWEEDGSLNWDAVFLALLVAGCISVLAGVISSYRSLRRAVRSQHRCLRQPLLMSEGGDGHDGSSGDLLLPVVLQHEDGLQQPGYVLLDHTMAPLACWPSKAVQAGAGAKQQHAKGGVKGDSTSDKQQQQEEQSTRLAPHHIVGAQQEAAPVSGEQQQQQEGGVVYAADHIAPSSRQ